MVNSNKICELKTNHTSVTVLYLYNNSLEDLRKYLRQQKKIAPDFFTACPIVLDFKNTIDDDFDFVLSAFNTLKEELMIPIGVSNVKKSIKKHLNENRIATFVTSNSVKEQEPKKEVVEVVEVVESKEIVEEKTKTNTKESLPLTKNINDSVRGGQKIMAEKQNLQINGAVNENGDVLSSGSISIIGALNGRAFAGISVDDNEGDSTATIFAHKFNATLISINGVFRVFEDGIPEEIKNKTVLIRLHENKLIIKKLG